MRAAFFEHPILKSPYARSVRPARVLPEPWRSGAPA
jgi:hypothetical protein